MKDVKTAGMLFGVTVIAAALHYVDNIRHLDIYPDLPTTTATDIALYGVIMLFVGVVGYLLYWRKRYLPAIYLFYLYCLMNLAVFAHYTPARVTGPFWDIPFRVHFFIFLEGIATMVFVVYVMKLHRTIRNRLSSKLS